MIWTACHRQFTFPGSTLVMGILNVTPDSFSDGGHFADRQAAIQRALELEAEGADILDVGGESTRPGATPVPEDEELRRVIPVLESLRGKIRIPISIDTQKTGVARAAIAAGAVIVNDIAANRRDDALWRLLAESGAGYVCMHMQGTPADMQTAPHYDDVVSEIASFFENRLTLLAAAGVPPEQVVFDPGLGFGKTLEHNLLLLANIARLTRLARPLMIGASRKSFLARLTSGGTTDDRLPGSIAAACWAAVQGADIVRVHDVAETRRALQTIGAILSRKMA